MDLRFTPEQVAFRDEVRTWLGENIPDEPLPSMDTPEGFEAHRRWERTLFDARWSVVNWPEAAILAACHSKARNSGAVPVDWTLRKYVRKPRKAPPGEVLVERAKTVFVEPDPAVEGRLRKE